MRRKANAGAQINVTDSVTADHTNCRTIGAPAMDDSHTWAPGECRAADFVAVGGVWLDEIRKGGKTLCTNVAGGSVTFATLGARRFSSEHPEKIRMVLFTSRDFPREVLDTFQHWHVGLTILPCGDVPAARGVMHYGNSESERYYQRLTVPLDTNVSNLNRIDLLEARCFHFFDVPVKLSQSIQAIHHDRRAACNTASLFEAPLLIWEPQAKSCEPETLSAHISDAQNVDVFSPNHVELASFFNREQRSTFDRIQVEQDARTFVESGTGSNRGCAVIIRCAEYGFLVVSRTVAPTWLPAYYGPESEKVVNTTGAGNAFLGSFAIGYQETGSYIEAAKYGAVGASFVVEQHGTPRLTGEGAEELWNGVSVRHRLAQYVRRCKIL